MIHVEIINAHLGQLTGDATKLAVHLCVLGAEPIRADKRWCSATAKKIGLTSAVFSKALRELHNAKLVNFSRRVHLAAVAASTSDGCQSLARASDRLCIADAICTDGRPEDLGGRNDAPPWEVDERSESRSASRSPPGDASSASNDASLRASAHQRVIDEVTRMYVDRYAAKPTWGPKQGAIVKRLLKSHPAEEIVRRARIMFYETRQWPKPPYDIGTLSVHFDKFAVARVQNGVIGDARKTGATYYGEIDDV